MMMCRLQWGIIFHVLGMSILVKVTDTANYCITPYIGLFKKLMESPLKETWDSQMLYSFLLSKSPTQKKTKQKQKQKKKHHVFATSVKSSTFPSLLFSFWCGNSLKNNPICLQGWRRHGNYQFFSLKNYNPL